MPGTTYKNIQESLVLPKTSNEQMGFKIKQMLLFIIAHKKYLKYQPNGICEGSIRATTKH